MTTLSYLWQRQPVRTENPLWAQVEDGMRRLDGKGCSELSLEREGGSVLMACGGGNGKYVVDVSDGRDFKGLLSVGASGPGVVMNVAGQKVTVEARRLVDLGAALSAARVFFDRGELDPGGTWEFTS